MSSKAQSPNAPRPARIALVTGKVWGGKMPTSTALKFNTVTALPPTYEPSSVYIVSDSIDPFRAKMFVSDIAGLTVREIRGDDPVPGRAFAVTQWRNILSTPLPVLNGGVLNFSQVIADANKVSPISETIPGLGASISTPGTGGFIRLTPYDVTLRERLDFRFSVGVIQNGTDFFRFRLRRKVDGSNVNVFPVSIDDADIPEDLVTTSTISYAFGGSDPFYTTGFLFDLANNSGQTVTVTSWELLIFRSWEKV
jgi:hypothetical protein